MYVYTFGNIPIQSSHLSLSVYNLTYSHFYVTVTLSFISECDVLIKFLTKILLLDSMLQHDVYCDSIVCII